MQLINELTLRNAQRATRGPRVKLIALPSRLVLVSFPRVGYLRLVRPAFLFLFFYFWRHASSLFLFTSECLLELRFPTLPV